jgi:hypothetical protein
VAAARGEADGRRVSDGVSRAIGEGQIGHGLYAGGVVQGGRVGSEDINPAVDASLRPPTVDVLRPGARD